MFSPIAVSHVVAIQFWQRVLATFFIGSIFDRIVRVHHSSRNFAAQAG
jgi:hypothetical protein